MMQKYSLLLLMVVMFSCKKNESIMPAESNVTYTVTITSKWSLPQFVVPSGAHFTNFVGMVHSADTFLWSNRPATPGLEFVAEVGSNWRMMNELDSIISKGKALSQFSVPPPVIGGAVQFPLNL